MVKVGGIDSGILKSYIERVESLEEEKKATTSDIKEVFAEAKAAGFNVKAMREIIKLRKMDQADYADHATNVQQYKTALGMSDLFEGTEHGPIGDAPTKKAAAKPSVSKPKLKSKVQIAKKPTATTEAPTANA